MLRRWVSIVLGLRKSVSAIWRFVRRSQTSSAISSSRSRQRREPGAARLAARAVAAHVRRAARSALACRVAALCAPQVSKVSAARWQLGDRLLAAPCSVQRLAREQPCTSALDGGSGATSRRRRPRARASPPRRHSPRASATRASARIADRGRERKPEAVGDLPGQPADADAALELADGEMRDGQRLEQPDLPEPADERQLGSAAGVVQRRDRGDRPPLHELELPEEDLGVRRDDRVVDPLEDVDDLRRLGRGPRAGRPPGDRRARRSSAPRPGRSRLRSRRVDSTAPSSSSASLVRAARASRWRSPGRSPARTLAATSPVARATAMPRRPCAAACVVALDVHLGQPEELRRLQARRRAPRPAGRRRGARPRRIARRADSVSPTSGIDERDEREAGGGVRGTPARAAQLLGAAAPVPDRLHVTAVEGVHRERDDERELLVVRVAGQIGERGLSRSCAASRLATQVLESRSGHRQPDALADIGQAERRDRLPEGLLGILEPSRAAWASASVTTAARAGGTARLRGSAAARPRTSGRRMRAPGRARADAARDQDARWRPRRPARADDGDVVRVRLRRRARARSAPAARPCAPQPPAGARRVVDRAADEGMAHREAPRPRGRSHEADGDERRRAPRARRPRDTRHRRRRCRARSPRRRSRRHRGRCARRARARRAPPRAPRTRRAGRRAAPPRPWRRDVAPSSMLRARCSR